MKGLPGTPVAGMTWVGRYGFADTAHYPKEGLLQAQNSRGYAPDGMRCLMWAEYDRELTAEELAENHGTFIHGGWMFLDELPPTD